LQILPPGVERGRRRRWVADEQVDIAPAGIRSAADVHPVVAQRRLELILERVQPTGLFLGRETVRIGCAQSDADLQVKDVVEMVDLFQRFIGGDDHPLAVT